MLQQGLRGEISGKLVEQWDNASINYARCNLRPHNGSPHHHPPGRHQNSCSCSWRSVKTRAIAPRYHDFHGAEAGSLEKVALNTNEATLLDAQRDRLPEYRQRFSKKLLWSILSLLTLVVSLLIVLVVRQTAYIPKSPVPDCR
jgi:hypothetical protein